MAVPTRRAGTVISEDTIAQAVATLVAAANPKRIVLFGSYARGDADEGSDLDLMVVSADEMARLRREPNSVHWWALHEGRVLHGAGSSAPPIHSDC